ncbi:MAG: SdiA-regulated domain-containing protein [Planctomycetes bacterium]|nr:SdiA-regulated domain-containing protein [Planctomycetota bacterium]
MRTRRTSVLASSLLSGCATLGALVCGGSLHAQNVANEWPVVGAQAPFVGAVAHHPFTDRVFACDTRNLALVEYSRTGVELTTASTFAMNPSAFHQVVGLAVDELTGSIYLGDESEDLIEWDPFQRLVVRVLSVRGYCSDLSGVSCDAQRRELYVVDDTTREVIAFRIDGTYLRRFSLAGFGILDPDAIAYVPWGNGGFGSLLIGDDQLDTLFELSLDGTRSLRTARVFDQGVPISPEGLEVDSASGSLFLGDGDQGGRVLEIAGFFGSCTGGTWVYGSACRDDGGGAPAVRLGYGGAARRCPRPGILLLYEATTTSSATHGGLILGISDVSYQGVSLPFDLAGIGAPGCALLASPDILLTQLAVPLATRGPGKVASLVTLVPNLPALSGRTIYLQGFFGPDALRPQHPLSWSHGLRVTFE